MKDLVYAFRHSDTYMDYAIDDPAPTNGWRNFYWYLVKTIIKKPLRPLIKIIKARMNS